MSKTLTPITPGEILLEEFLKPLGISQNELAKAICVPPNRISQIVNWKREITADTALRLGIIFGIEPEFWLNLQSGYDIKVARNILGKELEKKARVYSPNAPDLTHTSVVR
jgi:addiction module HigA family antidote